MLTTDHTSVILQLGCLNVLGASMSCRNENTLTLVLVLNLNPSYCGVLKNFGEKNTTQANQELIN